MGAYIRERLQGDLAEKRQTARKPKADEQQLALVLSELGHSQLSANLNQLAKAINTAAAEVERELLNACQAVAVMRDRQIAALGLKVEG